MKADPSAGSHDFTGTCTACGKAVKRTKSKVDNGAGLWIRCSCGQVTLARRSDQSKHLHLSDPEWLVSSDSRLE